MRVVLDTNIFVSAIVYGGDPQTIFQTVLDKRITAVTSPILLTELFEILIKKFDFTSTKIQFLERKLKKVFVIVYPANEIHVLSDDPDNRVLEAATSGECEYIVTGDKELLRLEKYEGIVILSVSEFIPFL